MFKVVLLYESNIKCRQEVTMKSLYLLRKRGSFSAIKQMDTTDTDSIRNHRKIQK